MHHKVAIIIPAKGGSVRIPNKNIQKLADGSTLLQLAINKAKSISKADVFVSTDSAIIVDQAIDSQVSILARPLELSDDFYELMRWEFTHLLINERYDYVFHLHCTAPFLKLSTVRGVIDHLLTWDRDSIFTAYPDKLFLWSNVDSPLYDTYKLPKSQEIPYSFVESHGMYGIKPKVFMSSCGHRYPRTIIYPISQLEAFDINEKTDLEDARRITGVTSWNSL